MPDVRCPAARTLSFIPLNHGLSLNLQPGSPKHLLTVLGLQAHIQPYLGFIWVEGIQTSGPYSYAA